MQTVQATLARDSAGVLTLKVEGYLGGKMVTRQVEVTGGKEAVVDKAAKLLAEMGVDVIESTKRIGAKREARIAANAKAGV